MVTTLHFDLDIDTTLGGNNASDYVIPSQKAIKSYVDNTGSTVDQTFDSTSANAQSGVAIAGELSSYATQLWAQQQSGLLFSAMQTWVQNQGYTTNVGTVTSVNNTSPDANGNVTLSIPTNYVQATNGNTSYTNTGTETTMGYTDTSAGERYGVVAGKNTTYGTGIILGAQNGGSGYLSTLTTSGLTLMNATNPPNIQTALLTVSNNNLAVNGTEVALTSDIPTVDQTFNGSSANAQSGVAIATQIVSLLEALYPVGSVYIGTMATCPIALLGVGTWTLVAQDKVLQGAGTGGNAGGTLSAGLPEIQGSLTSRPVSTTGDGAITGASGAFTHTAKGGTTNVSAISLSSNTAKYDTNVFKASNSSSIYGNSTTVQPPAYLVNIWERTA